MTAESINQWFDLFLAVAAAVVVVGGLFRWLNRKLEARIIQEIHESTRQVRTNANGGQSLNDLHAKVDGLCSDVALLKNAVVRLEDDVEGLLEE